MATVYTPDMGEMSLVRELLSLSDVAKRRIIHLLELSISNHDTALADEKKHTEQMLKKFAGAWTGGETADEIMQKVRERSSIRKPISF